MPSVELCRVTSFGSTSIGNVALCQETAIDPACREKHDGEHQRPFRKFCDPNAEDWHNHTTL